MVKTAPVLSDKKCCGVALFGGSFDPPHLGHQSIVRAALRLLPISHVYIVPSVPREDKAHFHASATDRLNMLNILFAPCSNVSISVYELCYPLQKSKTFYTLRHFRAVHRSIYLLMGQDAWVDFDNWFSYQAILKMAKICVFSRENSLTHTHKTAGCQKISIPNVPTSSSQIRSDVMQKRTLTPFLTPAVIQYIHEKRLYTL